MSDDKRPVMWIDGVPFNDVSAITAADGSLDVAKVDEIIGPDNFSLETDPRHLREPQIERFIWWLRRLPTDASDAKQPAVISKALDAAWAEISQRHGGSAEPMPGRHVA